LRIEAARDDAQELRRARRPQRGSPMNESSNEPCRFVIFGVTGDLASRKLLPSLYDLDSRGHLDGALRFVGLGRREWDDQEFRGYLRRVLSDLLTDVDSDALHRLTERFEFVWGAHGGPGPYERLARTLREGGPRGCNNVAFYLAVPPDDFALIVRKLNEAGLDGSSGRNRIVVEKPFGHDLESAREL